MKDQLLEHDLLVRRLQLRLVVAGLTIPPTLFVTLAFILRREADGSLLAGSIVGVAFLLTAVVVHAWRVPKRQLGIAQRQGVRVKQTGAHHPA